MIVSAQSTMPSSRPMIVSSTLQARQFLIDQLAVWKPRALKCSAKSVGLIQRQDLATAPALLAVLENSKLYQLMRSLMVSMCDRLLCAVSSIIQLLIRAVSL